MKQSLVSFLVQSSFVVIAALYFWFDAVPELLLQEQDYLISNFETTFNTNHSTNGSDGEVSRVPEVKMEDLNTKNFSIEVILTQPRIAGVYAAANPDLKMALDDMADLFELEFYKYKKPKSVLPSRQQIQNAQTTAASVMQSLVMSGKWFSEMALSNTTYGFEYLKSSKHNEGIFAETYPNGVGRSYWNQQFNLNRDGGASMSKHKLTGDLFN